MRSALLITNNPKNTSIIRSAYTSPVRLKSIGDVRTAIREVADKRYEVVFADLDRLTEYAQGKNPESVLQALQSQSPLTSVVIITAAEQMRLAVRWVKAGADDLITLPLDSEQIQLVADAIASSHLKESELEYLRTHFWKTDALDVVRTQSPSMADVFKKIRSAAPTKTTVLLMGETGTGKTVLAKLIHQHSNRQHAQFISVHCGAIPDTLIESELFGHEKGAFTGAVRKKMGKFEMADGGTIFLDEIGTLSPAAQIKLLQILQDGTFCRVGSEELAQTNARVVAATNEDLKQLSDAGTYRKDLFYRLNVFPIEIPPLRNRIEDLPRLMEGFLDRLNLEMQKNIRAVHPEVLSALSSYDWPGNVRELENLVERAYILENSDKLTPESFPLELFDHQRSTAVLPLNTKGSLSNARQQALEDFERQYLKALLTRNKGKINTSAQEAGISTRQLHKMMRKYDIRKEAFK